MLPMWSIAQFINNQSGVGGSEDQSPTNMIVTDNGEIYVLSWCKNPNNDGDINVEGVPLETWFFWLIKYNSDLSIAWQKGYGGDGDDLPFEIIDVKDGILLGGETTSTPNTGNKTAITYGLSDYWLLKIDYDGNVLWQKSYGGDNLQALRSIVALPNNQYLLAGGSRSNASGVKTENSYGFSDYWAIKIDSEGEIIWDKTIGSVGDERQRGATLLYNNTILITGASYGTAASGLKTEPNNSTAPDIWLVCLDLDGNILWDKVLGGVSEELYIAVTSDADAIYACIESFSDISGQRTTSRKGPLDIWVVKLDFDGNIVWDKAYGGNSGEMIGDAFYDNDRIYVGASSYSNISIDKTEDSKGNIDYWPFTIDLNGVIIDQKTIGGSDEDMIRKMVKHNEKVYILGHSNSDISGDKTSPNYGWFDIWLVEIDASTLQLKANFAPENVVIYPNPFVNEIQIELNKIEIDRIEIMDISGKLVLNQTVSNPISDKITISTEDFSPGIYTVNFISKHFSYSKKIVRGE